MENDLKKRGFKYLTLGVEPCEIRRLIQQGAVKINGKKTSEILFAPEEGMVIQVGKGNVFKLKEQEKNKALTKTL